MHPYMSYLEGVSERNISRRGLLKLGAAAFTAASLKALTPRIMRSSELQPNSLQAYSERLNASNLYEGALKAEFEGSAESSAYNIPAWTDKNYFPYYHNHGLPSLADDYYGNEPGPLKLHDIAHRIVFEGIPGSALNGAKRIAASIPESAASWAGHCGDLAKVNGLDLEPDSWVETPLGYISRRIAIGLMVAVRSHTPMESIPNTPSVIRNIVDQGHPLVLNIPDGATGNWNRTTTGRFTRLAIEVTNLGSYKWYPYSAIEGAWSFVPRQDSIPQYLIDSTNQFAIPGVRREVVEFLMPGYLNPIF